MSTTTQELLADWMSLKERRPNVIAATIVVLEALPDGKFRFVSNVFPMEDCIRAVEEMKEKA